MTDPMAVRDERFAVIQDPELEHILARMKAVLVATLREGIDEIGVLPTDGKPGLEARRRAELAWLGAVLLALDPPQ